MFDLNWNTTTREMEIRDPRHPTYVPLCGNRCWALIPTNLDWFCYDVDLPNWMRILKRIGLYLRVNRTAGPVTNVLENLQTFYGANYLRLAGRRDGVVVEIKVFPHVEESLLYLTVSGENTSDRTAEVKVLFAADFELHPAPMACKGFTQEATADYSGMGRKCDVPRDDMIRVRKNGTIFLVSDRRNRGVGFIASQVPTGWLLDRSKFSFETPLRGYRPGRADYVDDALELTNEEASDDSFCAFLHGISLRPRQKRRIAAVVGYQPVANTTAILEALRVSENAFGETKTYYQTPLVKGVKVETPDPVLNAQFNIYNLFMKLNEHHTAANRAFLPAAHYYNWVCGDSEAVLPAYAYTHDLGPIIDSINLFRRHQHADGFIPNLPLWTQGKSWRERKVASVLETILYPISICQVLKIMRNRSFAEDVYPSLKKALDATLANEKEGLIFPGGDFGFDALDWPVGFGHCPQVFMSAAAFKGMMELRDLSLWLGEMDYAGKLLGRAEKLKKTINEKLWMEDRGHYRVGLAIGKVGRDDGDAELFSRQMVSWGTLVAVLWGVAEGDRAGKAMRTIRERLFTPCGLKFFDPHWSPSYTDVKGQTYEAGRVQNGAFWHTWWSLNTYITANLLLGNVEEGLAAFREVRLDTTYARFKMKEMGKELSFIHCGEMTDTDMTFPVDVIPYTLTAAFFNQMFLEAILGVRIEYDILRIEPHLPASWDKATISNLNIGDSVWTIEMSRSGTPAGILLDSRETRMIPITPGKHLVQIAL